MWKKAVLIVSLALNVMLVSYMVSEGNVQMPLEDAPQIKPATEEPHYFQIKGYFPADGFVPDSLTAVRIAQAVWLPIYGKNILTQEPYIVELVEDSLWRISGSLPKGPEGTITVGGVAHATIRKSDGKIVHIIHGK